MSKRIFCTANIVRIMIVLTIILDQLMGRQLTNRLHSESQDVEPVFFTLFAAKAIIKRHNIGSPIAMP